MLKCLVVSKVLRNFAPSNLKQNNMTNCEFESAISCMSGEKLWSILSDESNFKNQYGFNFTEFKEAITDCVSVACSEFEKKEYIEEYNAYWTDECKKFINETSCFKHLRCEFCVCGTTDIDMFAEEAYGNEEVSIEDSEVTLIVQIKKQALLKPESLDDFLSVASSVLSSVYQYYCPFDSDGELEMTFGDTDAIWNTLDFLKRLDRVIDAYFED